MKTKAVILNLRVARREDFADELGQKKFGCMYFEQSFDGSFCNQPFFFHENTNMESFRELYATKQIWVLAGIFDEVEFVEKRKPIIKVKKYGTKKNDIRSTLARPCLCKRKR
ncbi:hypothetical protein GJU43_15050 [Flavobacterium sp. LC2016-23]|uniref:hypothetical protein n=1 Tax=Flavobacterium sp. LC2016-23 TaxID=2666330 RepID=UPI0012AEEDF4|nr:hypothetical protein [Flavobacterium sp. LC2016-23]MRX40603.1 hypothetical protein [Flavobacterium sp. LC2016-23]